MADRLTIDDRPVAHAASATLTPRHHGVLQTNRGAAGAVVLTLPPGQKGHRQPFQKITAQTFTVAAAGAERILNSAGAEVATLVVQRTLELLWDGTNWLVTRESPAADDTVTAAQLADGAVDAAAKIVGGVVTPPKLDFTGLKPGHFAGRNGAGACTLVGAAVGDRVVCGWKSGDVSDHNTAGEGVATVRSAFVALFETAITVVDEIQQASATDLSDNKYTVWLAPAAA